jgi:hypothetical protein
MTVFLKMKVDTTILKNIIFNIGMNSLKVEYMHWMRYKKKHKRNTLLGKEQIRKFSNIECENSFLSFKVNVLEEKINKASEKPKQNENKCKRNLIPTKVKRCKRIDPLDKPNEPKQILNYLRIQLITVENYKNKYKSIDNFDSSKLCDFEEIKKITIQIKANQIKDFITYGKYLHKLKQKLDVNEKKEIWNKFLKQMVFFFNYV